MSTDEKTFRKSYKPIFNSIDALNWDNTNLYFFDNIEVTQWQRNLINKKALYSYNNFPLIHSCIEKIIDFSIQNGINYTLKDIEYFANQRKNEILKEKMNKRINSFFEKISYYEDSYLFLRNILRRILLFGRCVLHFVLLPEDDFKIEILNEFKISEIDENTGDLRYLYQNSEITLNKDEYFIMNNSPNLSVLYPVLESCEKIKEYIDIELTNANVASLFSVFITREQATDSLFNVQNKDVLHPSGLYPGAIFELNDGEKIESVNPTRPNPNFSEYVRQNGIFITSCLGVPYEIAVQNFQNSYSASRAAFSVFKLTCIKYQNLLDRFYFWFLLEKKLKAVFKNDNVYKIFLNGNFVFPIIESISPIEDLEVLEKKRDLNISTARTDALAINGE